MDYLNNFKSSAQRKSASQINSEEYERPFIVEEEVSRPTATFIVREPSRPDVQDEVKIISDSIEELMNLEEEVQSKFSFSDSARTNIRVTPHANYSRQPLPNASYIFEAINSFVSKIQGRLNELENEYSVLYQTKTTLEEKHVQLVEEHQKLSEFSTSLEEKYNQAVSDNQDLSLRLAELEKVCSQQSKLLGYHRKFIQNTKQHLDALSGL